MLGQGVRDPLSLFPPTPVGSNSESRFVPTFTARPEEAGVIW